MAVPKWEHLPCKPVDLFGRLEPEQQQYRGPLPASRSECSVRMATLLAPARCPSPRLRSWQSLERSQMGSCCTAYFRPCRKSISDPGLVVVFQEPFLNVRFYCNLHVCNGQRASSRSRGRNRDALSQLDPTWHGGSMGLTCVANCRCQHLSLPCPFFIPFVSGWRL